jgi:ABC-type taurine transport system ATPase subunit
VPDLTRCFAPRKLSGCAPPGLGVARVARVLDGEPQNLELALAPPNSAFDIGPSGSGKTRLVVRLAERVPNAGFLGLERARTTG